MAQTKTAASKSAKKPAAAKGRKSPAAKSGGAASSKSKAASAKAKPTKKAAAKPAKKAAAKSRPNAGEEVVTIDRRTPSDRREEATGGPKLERREKVNRRRQIDPTTCERDYSDQEVEFMNAMDEYKRRSGRMFPTCSEVLEVIRDLGYVKLSPADAAAMAVQAPAPTLEDEAERQAEEALAESEALRAE